MLFDKTVLLSGSWTEETQPHISKKLNQKPAIDKLERI
jgi:hypothetical protein